MSAPSIPAPPIPALAVHAPVGFAPAQLPPVVPPPQPGDPLDHAGAAIIALVRHAAERTSDEADRALLLAHGLAQDLRAAEERAARLEAEVARLRQRAANAEGWLARIHQEIGHKLLTGPAAHSSAG